MVKVYDVPADILIKKLVNMLKEDSNIEPPTWSHFGKTGAHTERIPMNSEWWYVRCASLLRKVYVHGPIGLTDLKSAYGGRRRIGYSAAHHRDAGGSAIRKALQQLEQSGYLVKADSKGRMLTSQGMKMMDGLSKQIHLELIEVLPELKRYG